MLSGPAGHDDEEKLVMHRPTALSVLFALSLVPAFAVVPLGCTGDDGEQPSQETPDSALPEAETAPADATVDHTMPEASTRDAVADQSQDVTEEPIADAAAEAAADAADGGDCPIDSISGEPVDLRCTGLYSDWTAKTVAAGNVEYDPGLHLWSDGAVKKRWVHLPPGSQIDTRDMDEWTFPMDTKFWKQFVVNGVYIETRLLHKQPPNGTWAMVTYRWAPDLSTATLFGGATNVNDAGYEIPTHQSCVYCHQGRVDAVLGFEAVSLSSPMASGMPMQTLLDQNLLTNPPSTQLAIPGDTAESAALGYLHANCGTSCHNANRGLAHTTGFYMRLDVAKLGSVMATDTYTTGWGKPTNTMKFADAGVTTRIAACSPATSCVYYRPSHRDGVNSDLGVQMPPIDTHQIDPNGLATIAAWIDEGCTADASTDH